MAKQRCANCHKTFSLDLSVCPYCKHRVKKGHSSPGLSDEDIIDALSSEDSSMEIPPGAIILEEDDSDEDELPQKPEPKKTKIRRIAPETKLAPKQDLLGRPRQPEERRAPKKPLEPKRTKIRRIAPETKLASEEEVRKAAEETPPGKADPKKTKIRRISPETKLASEEELRAAAGEEPAAKADPKKTRIRKITPETKLASEEELRAAAGEEPAAKADPKKTRIRKITPETKLAEDLEPYEITEDDVLLEPESEKTTEDSGLDLAALAEQEKADPKKTRIRRITPETRMADSDEPLDLPTEVTAEDLIEEPGAPSEAKTLEAAAPADVIEEGGAGQPEETHEIDLDDLLTTEEEAGQTIREGAPTDKEEAAEEGKKKAVVIEGEDEEYKPRKKKKTTRPRYGRRWAGGIAVGMLLATGVIGGVGFLRPDLVIKGLEYHPDFKVEEKIYPAHLRAWDKVARRQPEMALTMLPVQGGKLEEKSTRALARLLAAIRKQQGKKAIDWSDPELKLALGEIETVYPKLHEQLTLLVAAQQLNTAVKQARNLLVAAKVVPKDDPRLKKADALPALIQAVLQNRQAWEKAYRDLETVQKAIADKLVKAKIVPPDDPRVKQAKLLPSVIDAAIQSKNVAEAMTDGLIDVLVKNGIAVDRKKLKTTFEQAIKGLKEDSATVGKLVQMLKADRKKIPDAVTQLQLARANLEKQVQDLLQVAQATLDVLTDKNAKVDPGKIGEQLKKAAEVVRDRARAPFITSVSDVVAELGGVGAKYSMWLAGLAENGALRAQLALFRAREPLVAPPEKKIEMWIDLFQRWDRSDPKQIGLAVKDCQWVLSPKVGASLARKAQAKYLLGLIQRNRAEFDSARALIGEALEMAAKLNPSPSWLPSARTALAELTDGTRRFLPEAQKAYRSGRLDAALQIVNVGLQAIPNDPHLKVMRALVALEKAKENAARVEQAVRRDLGAAINHPETCGKAHFVLGKLEQALGNMDKAEEHYRQAIKVTPADRKDEIETYRIALSRLLLQISSSNDRPNRRQEGIARGYYVPFGAALVIGFQPEQKESVEDAHIRKLAKEIRVRLKTEEKAKALKVEKMLQEAEELLFKFKGNAKLRGQGYMLLGRSMSEVGLSTDGLRFYLKGLQLFAPGVEVGQLRALVEQHPAFQLPDALTQPSPIRAEQHYGRGQHLYWEGKYSDAELQFRRAISYHAQDARFHYFLGLALLRQGKKREAEHHFNQAARLEIQQLPSSDEVNESLERVQGELRVQLNEFRRKAALEGSQ